MKGILPLFMVVGMLGLSGCGSSKYYPVSGVIVDMDGNPVTELAGGSVNMELEGSRVSSQGEIQKDGSFTMTTEKAGDGCEPGKQRVSITRNYKGADSPDPRVIPAKYDNFQTSGLEITVEQKANTVELKVERIKKKG